MIVLDEFTIASRGTLHSLDEFLAAAAATRLRDDARISISHAAGGADDRLLRIRSRHAIATRSSPTSASRRSRSTHSSTSGARYADAYRRGVYGYRLLQFRR